MTPIREAFALPAIFLSVFLSGGLRFEPAVAFTAPPPFALVLAILLLAVVVRSGTLAPEFLVGPHRGTLANLNGTSVLLTCAAASAQAIALVIPDTGLPELLVATLLLALLVQAMAMAPDRTRLLRGMLVTFGAAFTLKFIVLAALSSPAESLLSRVLQLMFESATFGVVTQPPPHPAAAYVAFGTLILYLIGLALLPHAGWAMIRVKGAALPESTTLSRTST